jgi:hypothetical protein
MDKEDIRALEPKYTGNTRHLTEGEAAAIAHDPANQTDEDGVPEAAEHIPPLGLIAYNRNP